MDVSCSACDAPVGAVVVLDGGDRLCGHLRRRAGAWVAPVALHRRVRPVRRAGRVPSGAPFGLVRMPTRATVPRGSRVLVVRHPVRAKQPHPPLVLEQMRSGGTAVGASGHRPGRHRSQPVAGRWGQGPSRRGHRPRRTSRCQCHPRSGGADVGRVGRLGRVGVHGPRPPPVAPTAPAPTRPALAPRARCRVERPSTASRPGAAHPVAHVLPTSD